MLRNFSAATLLVAISLMLLAGFGATDAQAGCINVYVDEFTAVEPGSRITLPIYVSDVQVGLWPVYSFDIEVHYCQGQDDLLDFVEGSLGDLTEGWTYAVNEVQPGVIRIAAAGYSPLVGMGTIFNLVFDVNPNARPCDVCDVDIVSMTANDPDQGVDVCTDGGQVYVDSESCDGYITHAKRKAGIPGVKVRLYGTFDDEPFQRTVFTDENGYYSFECLPVGLVKDRIVVTKDYNQADDEGIDGQDALAVLRYTVGAQPLSYYSDLFCGEDPDDFVGDANADDTISSYDASLILQFMVSRIEHLPARTYSDWVFCPSNGEQTWNVATDFSQGCPDFTGVLLGDVDADWTVSTAARPAYTVVNLTNTNVVDGDEVVMTVALDGGVEIHSGMIEIAVPDGLHLKRATPIGEAMGALSAAHQVDGVARIAFARVEAMDRGGDVFEVRFEGATGRVGELEVTSATFEGGTVVANSQGKVGNTPASRGFEVLGNRPNPFNPATEIMFYVPKAAKTSVKIYNMSGRLVRTLVTDEVMVGNVGLTWDGTSDRGETVASGVYIYKVNAGSWEGTGRMVLLK